MSESTAGGVPDGTAADGPTVGGTVPDDTAAEASAADGTAAEEVPEAVRKGWRPSIGQVLASIGSLLLAALLIVVVLPRAVHTNWTDVGDVLSKLSVWDIALMTGFWALGLWLYTFVYTGSLPGISHSKGLALNLTGSLVSNIFPFGGAAGVATTYGLTYSWGFSGVSTALMILVTGLANLLIRLVLPVVGLIALFFSGVALSGTGGSFAIVTLLLLAAVAGALILMLFNARVAAAVGSLGDAIVGGVLRLLGKEPHGHSLRQAASHLQQTAVSVVRKGWPAITFGMCAYYFCEIIFFGIGLHALGSDIGWASITAAFALSRVLTSVVVTPSGVGISETVTAGLLVVFGVPAETAAAAMVVLFIYTYLIELPTGVAGWVWVFLMRKRWTQRHFRRTKPTPAGPTAN